MRYLIFPVVVLLTICSHNSYSQSLSVNTTGAVANASSILDVSSTSKGMLIPRMDKSQKNLIASPATGLLIFQTLPDSIGFHYYDGAKWVWLSNNSPILDTVNWKTHGNAGLTEASNFLGNTDDIPISFRVNNERVGKFDRSRFNYSIGRGAGNDLGTAYVCIGDSAGNAVSNSFPGVYIGYRSGKKSTGSNNTFVGAWSGQLNTTGGNNVFFGTDVGEKNTSGSSNTFLGTFTATANTIGSDNIAIGVQTLNANTTGNQNIAIGKTSMNSNISGINNTAVGVQSLYMNTTGNENTAFGPNALFYNTGDGNTGLGWSALFNTSTGNYNTAVGYYPLGSNTTGYSNVAVGVKALYTNSISNNLVAIGDSSLYNSTGTGNTAIGSKAGYSLTTGTNNVFLGYQAGYSQTTGSNQLFIANSSANPPLIYGNFSTGKVGIGTISPGEKLEVNGNIQFSGSGTLLAAPSTVGSGYSVTIKAGDPYVPVGGSGGSVNILANNNMPSGGSGYGNLGPSGSINLTAGSGYNTAGGNVNITGGLTSYWALVNDSHSDVILKGGYNINAADAATFTAEGGHVISFDALNSNGGNLILKSGIGAGTGSQGNIQLLNGNVGIGTSAPSSKLEVCGNTRIIGTLNVSSTVTASTGITCPSDIRYKRNITALANPTQKLMKLNGVNYYWKTSEFPEMNFNDKQQVGFIAQEVEKIFPEMVFTNEAGYKSIDYSRLTPVLVETIKEQQKQIDAITRRMNEIEKMVHK